MLINDKAFEVTVYYDGEKYFFENAMDTFFFEIALHNNVPKKDWQEFIHLAHSLCIEDETTNTPIDKLGNYVACHWRKIKNGIKSGKYTLGYILCEFYNEL